MRIRLNRLARRATAVLFVLAVADGGATRQPVAHAAGPAQQPATTPSVTRPPAAPGTAAGEPTAVQETYEDWVVVCAPRDGKKACALTQQQTDQASRQRVLAIELNAVAADKAEGALVLPFGLAVSKDVTLQIDGAAFGPPLRFRTCIQAGCVVALAFDAPATATLRKGITLTITTSADNGQPVNFTVSLKGFGNGLNRTAALMK